METKPGAGVEEYRRRKSELEELTRNMVYFQAYINDDKDTLIFIQKADL